MAVDRFAEITRTKKEFIREDLKDVIPAPINHRYCELSEKADAPISYTPKISDKEALYNELQKMREVYSKYLKNYAPECVPLKEKINIENFVLDGKEKVSIPHYGGPTGYAKKVYESEFYLEEIDVNKVYNVCFGGVDYIATVYINGDCVGKHEGFFSPFKYNITESVKKGRNTIKVVVENDAVYLGNEDKHGNVTEHGDKLYAATGLGWDDSEYGWHHCPPGMGIYGEVYVEICNNIYISDLFVRPLIESGQAEIWVEVYSSDYVRRNLDFYLSIYGQNFEKTVLKDLHFVTKSNTEQGYLCKAFDEENTSELPCMKGINIYKILVDIENPCLWDIESPFLYNAQVSVCFEGKEFDKSSVQFGMRDFYQDTESEKKGMFYLNGQSIKLRGANTMGFEQQDVLRKDFSQLIDDILLAKLCNMNFWRLTQRPVQDEVYKYCDMLGLMTQTDLPLFGVMRRTKFAEGIRQAEEMERLIRSHPCNILVSYINEPISGLFTYPHRNMLREELENFFEGCDKIIHLNNPDRVIKYVDGDYDPPSKLMPDNHCYNFWYLNHNIEIGKMLKDYWCAVKPNWYYGCGEFGVEGLDFESVMKKYYPKEWLKEPFDPANIIRAQSGEFYRFFFARPKNLSDWVNISQKHQAESIKFMTEAFRRNNDMITFAVHLFIDAWPSGWMKTIMDCERSPKPAYFAYRNALEPVMLSLRTDRFTYFCGEEINIEAYICNDTHSEEDFNLRFELYNNRSELIKTGETIVKSVSMQSCYVASTNFAVADVEDRENFLLKAFLIKNGEVVTYNETEIEVFERVKTAVKCDDTVITYNLDVGEYEIAGEKVTVKYMPWGGVPFVAMNDKHEISKHFCSDDFKFWYDKKLDRNSPLADKIFYAEGFTPILISGDLEVGEGTASSWRDATVVGEKVFEGKRYIINLMDMRFENPAAERLDKFLKER